MKYIFIMIITLGYVMGQTNTNIITVTNTVTNNVTNVIEVKETAAPEQEIYINFRVGWHKSTVYDTFEDKYYDPQTNIAQRLFFELDYEHYVGILYFHPKLYFAPYPTESDFIYDITGSFEFLVTQGPLSVGSFHEITIEQDLYWEMKSIDIKNGMQFQLYFEK